MKTVKKEKNKQNEEFDEKNDEFVSMLKKFELESTPKIEIKYFEQVIDKRLDMEREK